MKKSKLLALVTLASAGGTLFHSCIGGLGGGGFWEGMFGRGWPTNNLWMNLGIDILNEELFG